MATEKEQAFINDLVKQGMTDPQKLQSALTQFRRMGGNGLLYDVTQMAKGIPSEIAKLASLPGKVGDIIANAQIKSVGLNPQEMREASPYPEKLPLIEDSESVLNSLDLNPQPYTPLSKVGTSLVEAGTGGAILPGGGVIANTLMGVGSEAAGLVAEKLGASPLVANAVRFATPVAAQKVVGRIARNAPMRAEEFEASAKGIDAPVMTQSMKQPSTVTRNTTGSLEVNTPIMASYRAVKKDGGFDGILSPEERLAKWEPRIEELEGQIDPLIREADSILPNVIIPDLREAKIYVSKMPLGDEKIAAEQYLMQQQDLYNASFDGTLSRIQQEKKAIYKKLSDAAYSKKEGAAPVWKDDIDKAIASNFKRTIEQTTAQLLPASSQKISDINKTLGAYYDLHPVMKQKFGQGWGKSVLEDISSLKGAAKYGLMGASGFALGGPAGAAAGLGGAALASSPVGKMGISTAYQALNLLEKGVKNVPAGQIGGLTSLASPIEQLQALVNAPQAIAPGLPRDWNLIKGSKSSLMQLMNLSGQMGLLTSPLDINTLSDGFGKKLVEQLVQISPQSFQPGPDRYNSYANGKLLSPIEQQAYMEEAKDLPPAKRAEVFGTFYKNGGYVPFKEDMEKNLEQEAPIDSLAAFNNLNNEPPTQNFTPNQSDSEIMLQQMNRHAQTYGQ